MVDATCVAVDLAVTRGRRRVLERCTFRLGPGVAAVVGRNGSGKSSLLRTLATVVPPAGGRLAVAGVDLADGPSLRRARSRLAYVPQRWDLPHGTRVRDALHHGAWLHRVDDGRARCAEVADALDLGGLLDQRLGQLSIGTHRRVAVAVAMVGAPQVLLLDEPTAGLDVDQRRRLWQHLVALGADLVVVVTHDLHEVAAHSDQVLLVQEGTTSLVPADRTGVDALADTVRAGA